MERTRYLQSLTWLYRNRDGQHDLGKSVKTVCENLRPPVALPNPMM